MLICPEGHDGQRGDFCAVCGSRLEAPGQLPPAGPQCPHCGNVIAGRFCEADGYDALTGQPGPQLAAPASTPRWTAVAAADRGYFDAVMAAAGQQAAVVQFPVSCPERRYPLTGDEARIGRRSAARGIEPEIDLTGPPADPGISRLHALLLQEPGGSWAILDPGSANGTLTTGTWIAAGVGGPLRPGDRIQVGAWTVITIEDDSPG